MTKEIPRWDNTPNPEGRVQSLTNVINFETPLGGAIYPFLEATGRKWSLVARSIRDPIHDPKLVTVERRPPTLRWVNGTDILDGFVEGLNTKQFLATSGLSLSLERGGYVLSKRLSRLMRPHFVSRFFPAEEVSIRYRDDIDPQQKKIWDGAGVISRRLLERLAIPAAVSPGKRDYLRHQLQSCRRVEFTLMTDQGQDKGHAIVADELPTDFVLPRDTKREVRLVNGARFVGIDFVHAREAMRLDIQSLINLHPFFEGEQLQQWLAEEGQLFVEAVKSGAVGEAMGRLDRHASLAGAANKRRG